MNLAHMIRTRSRWSAACTLVLFLTAAVCGAAAQDVEPGPSFDGQQLPIGNSGAMVASPQYAPQPTPDNVFGQGAGPGGYGYGQQPVPEDVGVGGMGVLSRFGHIAGQNIERQTSLTYLDLSPYMFIEDTYLFTDLRGFYTNDDQIGGSTGIGARHFFRNINTVLGGSFWYDMDSSRNGVQFDQVGVSLELFTEWLDVRANWYSPQGITRRDISTDFLVGSEHFVGNNLAFNTTTLTASSMEGGDMMFTIPVVGKLPQELNMELSAGWYHYQARKTDLDRVWGWKMRLDGDLFEKIVHSFLELSNDNVFKTNVVFGIDLNYWNGLESRPRLGTSQFNRIAQWTRRNRNVVTNNQRTINPDQLAINPSTGNPYVFAHIRDVPAPSPLPNPVFGAGDGSINNPYKYILEAFNGSPGADVYYVHADTVYDPTAPGLPPAEVAQIDDTLVIPDGKIVFGEYQNQQHNLPVVGFPNGVMVPRVTGGTDRPILQNITTSGGPIVQMGNNTTFSGFQILNALNGDGIGIDTVGGVTARDNIIDTTTGNGITVTNALGLVTLDRTTIANSTGNGLEVTGGNANVSLQSGSIDHSAAGSFAVLIQNNFGSVDLRQTTVTDVGDLTSVPTTDDGGLGVLIQNSASTNSFGSITIQSSDPLAGLRILDSSGNVAINDNVEVTYLGGPAIGGPAVEINNYSGNFNLFGDLAINNRNDIGVQLLSVSGTAAFLGNTAINVGSGGASGDAAINFQNSSGQVAFGTINITGSPLGTGILIGGASPNTSSASFTVAGTTLISGTGDSAIQIVDDAADVTFNGVTITGRQALGIEIENTSGRIAFNGITSDTPAAAATGVTALQIFDASGQISFANYQSNSVVSSDINPAVNVQNNTGGVSFGSLNVTGTGAEQVFFADNTSISTAGGRIINTGAIDANGTVSTVHVENSTGLAGNLVFDSIASTGVIESAIRVSNLNGSFTVRGTGTAAQNTIERTTIIGAEFLNVTNSVNLTGSTYQQNAGGAIGLLNVDSFTLANSVVSANGVAGNFGGGAVTALNVFDVTLSGNTISNNTNTNQILINAGTVGDYTVTMTGNTISETTVQTLGGDMVLIQDTGVGGSTLTLDIHDNGNPQARTGGFRSQRTLGFAALSVDWNGAITNNSSIVNNVFDLSGGNVLSGHTGTSIVQRNSTVANFIQYSGNTLQTAVQPTGGIGAYTGLFMQFAGQTTALITNNFANDNAGNPTIAGFQMNAINSTAMDLSFNGGGSNVTVGSNLINFGASARDGTGILFSSVDGGGGTTRVAIGDNVIQLRDDFLFPNELGIIFNSIQNGPIVLDSLNGGDNTVVNQNGQVPITVTPFFIPGGSSIGQILVNGSFVP